MTKAKRDDDWLVRLRSKGAELVHKVEGVGRDLGLEEMPGLVRRDSVKAYSFYQAAQAPSAEPLPPRGIGRSFALSKAVFLSFLQKLSPARRVSYVIALASFLWGFVQSDWTGGVIGFLVLNFLLALELAEKLLTKDELDIARAIQFSLYPVQNPKLEGLDVAAFFQPAQDVGGDYYDFALDGQRRFTVILGDVSGKGIPAALYAMKLQALFELLGPTTLGPKEMLVRMNDVISERIEKNYFITAVVAVLDMRAGRLALARAGHNHPLYYSKATGRTQWLHPNGMGIGMRKKPTFDDLMEESQIALESGDIILFYTDGVSEAMNPGNDVFGYDRMEQVLGENAHLTAEEIKGKLLEQVDAFRKGQPFADDVTLVVTKIP